MGNDLGIDNRSGLFEDSPGTDQWLWHPIYQPLITSGYYRSSPGSPIRKF